MSAHLARDVSDCTNTLQLAAFAGAAVSCGVEKFWESQWVEIEYAGLLGHHVVYE